MNKLFYSLLLTILSITTLYCSAQNQSKFSLSTGVGYFCDIEDIGFEVGTNNPRLKGIHGAVGTFIEFTYRLKSDYWVGVKYLESDLMYPNNDHGGLFWSEDKMISFDVYSIVIKKSFNKGKHYFDISGGPLLNDYNGSDFSYDDYDFVELDGSRYAVVLNPQAYNYHSLDLGLFLAVEYKYNITRNLNVGLKSDMYGLLYIGKQALTVMPVLEVRF